MAGAYCKFCDQRCFVLRVVPDGPREGWTGHMATCRLGMAHDQKVLGYNYQTAINPVANPEAAVKVTTGPGPECFCGSELKPVPLPADLAKLAGRERVWVHVHNGDTRCYPDAASADDRAATGEPADGES